MSPERKAKIIKFALGLLAAMGAAAVGYFSTNWGDLFSQVPFGIAIGAVVGLAMRI